jgi:TPR repeat protein
MGDPAMRDASATVGGGFSPTLCLGLPFALATVMILALVVGAAYGGPLAQQVQTVQRQNTSTADDLKPLQQKAEEGDVDAQFILGGMYFEGRGVPQDVIEAFKWSTVAMARLSGGQQQQNAAGRETLAKTMTPTQIAEARKRASEWTTAFEKRKK